MVRPIIVGITGGSGAGKSTLTKEIVNRLKEDNVTRIPLDNYMHRNAATNNSPEAINFKQLHFDLDRLVQGEGVVTPKGNTIEFSPILLIEGHLLMTDPLLVERLDLSIYIDLDSEERLLRRIQRNVGFGMELQGIIDWYRSDVKENFYKYIEPTKNLCDLILWGELTEKRIELVTTLISSLKMKKFNS